MTDPGIVTYEGVNPQSQIVYPTSATIAAPASVPTVVWNSGLVNNLTLFTSYSTCQVPAYHYTRGEHLRQMKHHRCLSSYYKQLKLNAENALRMQSVHPPELQRKRAQTPERSSYEPPLKRPLLDTGGIVIPDDAVEKRTGMPAVWDLAVNIGYLTSSEADNIKNKEIKNS